MAKIFDSVEIGLTQDELRQALRQWMNAKTLIHDYCVTDVSLHPGSKYVVRFTVEPPLEKTDQKAISQDSKQLEQPTN